MVPRVVRLGLRGGTVAAMSAPTAPLPGPRLGPGLVAAAAGVVVLAGLHAASSLVGLLVLSVIATILLVPVQAAGLRRGWPVVVALVAALAVYAAVLGVAALLLVVGLTGFLRDLPTYVEDIDRALGELAAAVGGAGTAPPADAAALGELVRSAASGALSSIATVGYSLFIVAYLLLEAPHASARLRWAFGPGTDAVVRGTALAERLRAYIVARAILGAVAALLDTLLLVVLGVPSALLWGILSFLLSFIPNVGFVLALIPPTVLALVIGGPVLAMAVVVGYTVINIAIDYVVQPRFIGGTVDISAVVVTVCLLFWGIVLGGAGALMAVPMTLIVIALFDAFDDTRPFARLLVARIGGPDD